MEELFDKIDSLREMCNNAEDESHKEFFNGIVDVLDGLAECVGTILYYAEGCGDDDCEAEYGNDEYTYTLVCPSCGQEFEIEEDDFDSADDIICPKCGEEVVLGDYE